MALDEGLRLKLDQVCIRLRRRGRFEGLGTALLAGSSAFLAARLLAWALWPAGWLWLAGPAFFLCGAIAYALSSRPPIDRLRAARLVDRELNLEERVSTAVEWVDRPGAAPTLLPWLHYDAANQAPFIKPQELVKVQPSRRTFWALPALALALFSVSPWMPAFPRATPAASEAGRPDPALEQQGKELELLAQRLAAQATEQRSPQLARLAADLARLAARMRQGEVSRPGAQQALADLERQLLDYQLQTAPTAPTTSLPGLTGPGPQLGPAIDLSRLEALTRALQAQGTVDDGLRRDLARQLAALREAGAADGERAERLQRITEALARGDAAAAQQELESLAADLREQMSQSGAGDSPLDDIRRQLAGSGESLSQPDGRQSAEPGGSAAGPTGPGSGSEYGEPIEGSPGSGPQAGSEPGAGEKTGRRFEGQAGYLPAPVGGRIGEGGLPKVAGIPGAAEEGQQPAASSPPARYAFGRSAEEAVQHEEVPVNYRQWVKRYFASLSPGNP